jgi:hypothetical protein
MFTYSIGSLEGRSKTFPVIVPPGKLPSTLPCGNTKLDRKIIAAKCKTKYFNVDNSD